jgi:hypothetical protein
MVPAQLLMQSLCPVPPVRCDTVRKDSSADSSAKPEALEIAQIAFVADGLGQNCATFFRAYVKQPSIGAVSHKCELRSCFHEDVPLSK